LIKRIGEHKNNMVEGFTKRYHVHQLVWYELHESMESAISSIRGCHAPWHGKFRRNDGIHKLALMPLLGEGRVRGGSAGVSPEWRMLANSLA
jgi:hypothetical protein